MRSGSWLIIFLIIQLPLVCVAPRPRVARPKLLSRGPGAWTRSSSEEARGLEAVGATRLLIHSVSDKTIDMYIKAVRPFLKHLLLHRISPNTPREWDRALASFLDDMCYLGGLNVNDGSKLVAGFSYLFPEFKEELPLSDRSIIAWQRLSHASEGGPIPLCAIFLIALRLIELGFAAAALAVLLSEDGYLREDDWENLPIKDIMAVRLDKTSPPEVGLLLGSSERGGTTKTGPDQGVIVQTPLLQWWVYYLLQIKDPAERLIDLSSAAFRRLWWRALDDLGLLYMGPPHSLRHSRPSADALAGLDLEQICRRGRWASQVGAAIHQGTPAGEANSPHGRGTTSTC